MGSWQRQQVAWPEVTRGAMDGALALVVAPAAAGCRT
jgi:hypothetical protein